MLLGVSIRCLVTSDALDANSSPGDAGLQEEDTVTPLVRQSRLVSGRWSQAFEFAKNNGTVETWGRPCLGGIMGFQVEGQLKGCHDIVAMRGL